jgi:hypothetical protein
MTGLKIETAYAVYRPTGEVTFKEAIGLVSQGIRHCVQNNIPRVLIDTSGLTGFKPPDTMDRYVMGEEWAAASAGAIIVAMVVRAELMDPQRFGLIVARNRGMSGEVFTSESEAISWLLKLAQPLAAKLVKPD